MEQFTIYYGTPEGKAPKIGVDSNYPRRVRQQRINNCQILEVHTCVYEVSDREQELQRQYGVKVDTVPYYVVYFKNKSAEQRAKTSTSLKGNTNCLGKTNGAGGKGLKRTEETKAKLSIAFTGRTHKAETIQRYKEARRTTTPELDLLVIQDIKAGMFQHDVAAKHNITRKVVRRIIKYMNE